MLQKYFVGAAALLLAGCASETVKPGPIQFGVSGVAYGFPKLASPADTPDTQYLLRVTRVEVEGTSPEEFGKISVGNGAVGRIDRKILDRLHAAIPGAKFKMFPTLHLVSGRKVSKENGFIVIDRNGADKSPVEGIDPASAARRGDYLEATLLGVSADGLVEVKLLVKEGSLEATLPYSAGDLSENAFPLLSMREINTNLTLYPEQMALIGCLAHQKQEGASEVIVCDYFFVEVAKPLPFAEKKVAPKKTRLPETRADSPF